MARDKSVDFDGNRLFKLHVTITEEARDGWSEVCAEEGCSMSALLSVIDPTKDIAQEAFLRARKETYRRRANPIIARRQAVSEAEKQLERRRRNKQ